jgi:hypothetical protein
VDRAGQATATRYSAQIEPATRVDLAFKVGGYVEAISKVRGVDGKPRIVQEGVLPDRQLGPQLGDHCLRQPPRRRRIGVAVIVADPLEPELRIDHREPLANE